MADILVLAMFLSLVAALLAGFPVAFSIAAVAAVFGALGVFGGYFGVEFLGAMRFRVEGLFRNENLLSLPLFLFMGMLLERTRRRSAGGTVLLVTHNPRDATFADEVRFLVDGRIADVVLRRPLAIEDVHAALAARGGDPAWREVLDYFAGATQIGLTATPDARCACRTARATAAVGALRRSDGQVARPL